MFFDIGVYLVVIGVMLDLARSLGVRHRPARGGGPGARPAEHLRSRATAGTGGRACRAPVEAAPMSPNLTLVLIAGVLVAAGVYLMHRAVADPDPGRRAAGRQRRQPAVPGGLRASRRARRSSASTPQQEISDPLPQAMVLTAIVITLGTTAFLLTMAYRSFQLNGHDEVADDVEDPRSAGWPRPTWRRSSMPTSRPSDEVGQGTVDEEDERMPDPAEEETLRRSSAARQTPTNGATRPMRPPPTRSSDRRSEDRR